jgi:hypothetical protein
MSHVVSPSAILATLKIIPRMSQSDKLPAFCQLITYKKLIPNEHLFHELLELPMEVGRE